MAGPLVETKRAWFREEYSENEMRCRWRNPTIQVDGDPSAAKLDAWRILRSSVRERWAE